MYPCLGPIVLEVGHNNGGMDAQVGGGDEVVGHLLVHNHLVDEAAANATNLSGNIDTQQSFEERP